MLTGTETFINNPLTSDPVRYARNAAILEEDPTLGLASPTVAWADTAFAAMHLLASTCLYGGKYGEAYVVANDLEQAQSRVFAAVRRMVEASPYLSDECKSYQSRIEFKTTGATIQAIGADYSGAAGSNPVIASFDELWGVTSERARRLWDEDQEAATGPGVPARRTQVAGLDQ